MKSSPPQQQGMVLVVTLVLMLILTIIATSSMQVSTMQERIAGNTRDTVTAFQAAETAIRQAENILEGASLGAFNGSDGRYEVCSPDDKRVACQKPDWKNRESSGWVGIENEITHVAKQPEYIVEKYSAVKNPEASLDADKPLDTFEFYRVTARGYGVSDNSLVVLQSTYRRN